MMNLFPVNEYCLQTVPDMPLNVKTFICLWYPFPGWHYFGQNHFVRAEWDHLSAMELYYNYKLIRTQIIEYKN